MDNLSYSQKRIKDFKLLNTIKQREGKKMKKHVQRVCVLIFAFTIAVLFMSPVSAIASTEDEIYYPKEYQCEYVEVQVAIEITNIDTGEIVSREYFDVLVPIEELEEYDTNMQSRVGIQPFRFPVIQLPFSIPAYPNRWEIASANSMLALTYPLRIAYERGNVVMIRFQVITGTFNTVLGSGFLREAEMATVTISGPTLSWRVTMGAAASHLGSGRGDFSVW